MAPDLPAHGRTPGHTTSLFELSTALAAVVRHEHPTAIVTHSLGFPALIHALDEGVDDPSQVIAIAPARTLRHALARFAERTNLSPTLVDELDRAMRIRYGDQVWTAFDVDGHLPHLTSRGLVIHVTADRQIDINDGERIAAQWPGATFVTTTGLGHRRILRNPCVRRLIAATLADNDDDDALRPPMPSADIIHHG